MLTTSVECVWALQALVGVERMPTALHLKPFIPSAHADLIVETTAGGTPLSGTAQYHSLVSAGVIDHRGQVDAAVRDWLTVLGRPDREVVLTIRRPDQPGTAESGPTVHERAMVVCRHGRFLAMAARDGAEMVIGGVGEADDASHQIELICQMLMPALGDHPPADIDGINVAKDVLELALDGVGRTRCHVGGAAPRRSGPVGGGGGRRGDPVGRLGDGGGGRGGSRSRDPPPPAGVERGRHRVRPDQFHHNDRC